MPNDKIEMPDAPAIPGLVFRYFRGPTDYPKMVEVIAASRDADQIEQVSSAEDLADAHSNWPNSDLSRDMIFTEVAGQLVGYSRGWWVENEDGNRTYWFLGQLAPVWRRKGIGSAMLHWMESRLRKIAESHPVDQEKYLQTYATLSQSGLVAMLEQQGYQPVRYVWQMIRPDLNDIPEFPLPGGLEVRPVLPEHYRPIWEASNEAMSGQWGFFQPTEEDYQWWLDTKTLFQPELWQIAWDSETNEVAGQVRTFIDHAENAKYNRKRGYTEYIRVGRRWRRRGVARALIALSLNVQKQRGMTESALRVDAENRTGASRVYEDCGFRVVKQDTIYRKSLFP